MIESPVLQNFVIKRIHKNMLIFLRGRFGEIPPETEEALRAIIDDAKLDELTNLAARCPDLESFKAGISA